jgi:hypothetical protein
VAATLPDSFHQVFGDTFNPRKRWLKRAAGIGDAYGLSLLLTLVTVLLTSMLPHDNWARVVAVASVAITSVVGLASSRVSQRSLRTAVGASAVAVVASGVYAATDSKLTLIVAFVVTVGLLLVTAVTILGRVLAQKEVTFRTILGALTTYTMLGLLFGFAYLIIDLIQTTPFFTDGAAANDGDFLFFSYTTLTTTGYGNLVPAGQPGESIAILEMLTGQIFLVTLVAGLVSLWRPGRRFDLDDDGGAK